MLNEKFCQKLKDAGFLQGSKSVHIPILSELIEACGVGDKDIVLWRFEGEWFADLMKDGKYGDVAEPNPEQGSTPEESMARLWLKLHNTRDE